MSTPTRYDDHPLAERVRENLAELAEATLVLRRWDEVPVVSMVPRARRRWVVAVLAAVVAAALVVATVVVVRVATGGRSVKPATPSGAEAPSRFVFDPPEGYREGRVLDDVQDAEPNPGVDVAREGFACVEYTVDAGAARCDAVGGYGLAVWRNHGGEAGADGYEPTLEAFTFMAPERADLGYLNDAEALQVRGHEGRLAVVDRRGETVEWLVALIWEEQPGVLVNLQWAGEIAEYPGDDWLLEIAENGRMEALGTSEGLPIAIEHRSLPLDSIERLLGDLSDVGVVGTSLGYDPFGTGRFEEWLVVRRRGSGIELGMFWPIAIVQSHDSRWPSSFDIDTPLGNRLFFGTSSQFSGEGGAFGAVPADAARVRIELRDGEAVEVNARGAELDYGAAFFLAEWSDEGRQVARVVALAADGRELANSAQPVIFEGRDVPEPLTFSTLEIPPPYTEDVAIASQGTADGTAWRLVVRPIYRGLCLGLGVGEPAPTTCIDEAVLDAVLDGAPIGLVEDEVSLVAGLVSDRVETVRVVFTDGSSVDVKPVRPSEVLTDTDLLAFAVEVPAGESVERIDAVDARGVTDSSAKPIVLAGG